MSRPQQRLLIIGLDGYDPAFAERLMNKGQLPAIERLMQTSAVVPLEHGAARRTGLAWEHFATGLTPADANRYSAVDFNPQTYTCSQRGTTLPPFVTHLGDTGVVVFDAPYFNLPDVKNANGLVAWGAHDPGVAPYSQPRSLDREIRQRFGNYPAKRWIYGHTWPDPQKTVEMGQALTRAVEKRGEITNWLLSDRFPDWRLGITVISELHSATEALWHGVDDTHPLASQPSRASARNAMHSVYEAVDAFIENIQSKWPDIDILAFTPHGMGRNESDLTSMALLPELMYRRTFGKPLLTAGERDANSSVVLPEAPTEAWPTSVRHYLPQGNEGQKPRKRRPGGVRRQWRQRLRTLKRALIPSVAQSSLGWMPANWYAPHWRNMDVFALPSFYDGQLRVNLQGREAAGRVALHEYDATIEGVIAELDACRDSVTGRPIVKEYVRNPHPPLDLGVTEADLVIVWNNSVDAITHPQHGQLGPIPFRRPGGHTGGLGIALITGSTITPGAREVQSAFDVVPTILDWLGRPATPLVSGQSFLPLLQAAAAPQPTIEHQADRE